MQISVVVPAYNAGATLDQTLQSVRRQTHADLEVLVVDDGSTDDTRAIAERHQASDPRVRILSQTNAGVAAARNAGWKNANSDLIAFIDADDLWRSRNLELQLECLRRAGPRTGLVYSNYLIIDSEGMVTQPGRIHRFAGNVLQAMLESNFIGNGSSILVRRDVLERCAGFDSTLREKNAQGCEDYLFYCRAAACCEFGVVPQSLVGYRAVQSNMSSDLNRMLRSWMLVYDEMLQRHPDHRATLEHGLSFFAFQLVQNALRQRRFSAAAGIVMQLARARHHRQAALVALQGATAVASHAIFVMPRKSLRAIFSRGDKLERRPQAAFAEEASDVDT